MTLTSPPRTGWTFTSGSRRWLRTSRPFVIPTHAATRLAEQRGRRRRALRRAGAGAATALGAASVLTAITVGPFTTSEESPVTADQPPSQSRPSEPSPSADGGVGSVWQLSTAGDLEEVGRAIAAIAGGGEPTPIPNYPTHWQFVDLGDAGLLEVIVMQDEAQVQPLVFRADLCQRNEPSGTVCQQLSLSDREGAWLRTYHDQPGRQSLEYELLDARGDGVWVKINNYPEYTPATSQRIGASLSDLGLTPDAIRAVVTSPDFLE